MSVIAAMIAIAAVVAPSTANAMHVGTYGPYDYPQVKVPIIGTCGNVWALATFTRTYTAVPRVYLTVTGTTAFTSEAGASPGACTSGANDGRTIAAGIHGTIHGRVVYVVGRGVFDPNAACSSAACDVKDFIDSFYGAGNDDTQFQRTRGYITFKTHNAAALACAPAGSTAATWATAVQDPTTSISLGDIATAC